MLFLNPDVIDFLSFALLHDSCLVEKVVLNAWLCILWNTFKAVLTSTDW